MAPSRAARSSQGRRYRPRPRRVHRLVRGHERHDRHQHPHRGARRRVRDENRRHTVQLRRPPPDPGESRERREGFSTVRLDAAGARAFTHAGDERPRERDLTTTISALCSPSSRRGPPRPSSPVVRPLPLRVCFVFFKPKRGVGVPLHEECFFFLLFSFFFLRFRVLKCPNLPQPTRRVSSARRRDDDRMRGRGTLVRQRRPGLPATCPRTRWSSKPRSTVEAACTRWASSSCKVRRRVLFFPLHFTV